MPTSDHWFELAQGFLHAKDLGRYTTKRLVERLARRGASWFNPLPKGDLYNAWLNALQERNKDQPLPRVLVPLCELSADLCNVLGGEALEREIQAQRDSESEPDLRERIRALEERLERTASHPPALTQSPTGSTRSESIGDQINRLREECHLTVEGLAEALGVDSRSVYRHLAGHSQPRVSHIGAYERVFSELLGRKVVISKTSGKRQVNVSKTSGYLSSCCHCLIPDNRRTY